MTRLPINEDGHRYSLEDGEQLLHPPLPRGGVPPAATEPGSYTRGGGVVSSPSPSVKAATPPEDWDYRYDEEL